MKKTIIKRFIIGAILGVSATLLAQATTTTNEGTGGGFWDNILSFIIGIVVSFVVQIVKPEWFIDWFLKLIDTKMDKKSANIVTNVTGYVAIKVGIRAVEAHPDEGPVQEGLQLVKQGAELIKKGLVSSKQ